MLRPGNGSMDSGCRASVQEGSGLWLIDVRSASAYDEAHIEDRVEKLKHLLSGNEIGFRFK